MKKLKLTVDALRVESFETAEAEVEQRGTVRGNASDSTCIERVCGCAEDTDLDLTCGTCNVFVNTCSPDCETYRNCPTSPGFLGC
ncbi:MAG TPA: pinensin family lanthipeptide [Longimicrobium sp.]|nr:pinensin family lanthipeptide [Longimicrobium sp.]